jgi:hypothetical protein
MKDLTAQQLKPGSARVRSPVLRVLLRREARRDANSAISYQIFPMRSAQALPALRDRSANYGKTARLLLISQLGARDVSDRERQQGNAADVSQFISSAIQLIR